MNINAVWYQPIDDNNIAVFISDMNNREYIVAECEYINHKAEKGKAVYNFCCKIVAELDYVLIEE